MASMTALAKLLFFPRYEYDRATTVHQKAGCRKAHATRATYDDAQAASN
jgi:hypothetical protein